MGKSHRDVSIEPITLVPKKHASSVLDMVAIAIDASDEQANGIKLKGEEKADFILSADALNYWRIVWRCQIEWNSPRLKSEITRAFKAGICEARDYDPDELAAALEATKKRARMPFGWTALDLAWHYAKAKPLRLLSSRLADSSASAKVSAIAYQLQKIQGESPIFLPIDQLRALLNQRKIVISGTVQRLIKAGIIEYADEKYHTGKAREFRFVGVEGEDFEFMLPESTPAKTRRKIRESDTD